MLGVNRVPSVTQVLRNCTGETPKVWSVETCFLTAYRIEKIKLTFVFAKHCI